MYSIPYTRPRTTVTEVIVLTNYPLNKWAKQIQTPGYNGVRMEINKVEQIPNQLEASSF